MVSFGPDTQTYNFTHMYEFTDYAAKQQPEVCITKGSLYDFLNQPNFSKFREIVDRAKMTGQLNDVQANFTIFVPTNASLKHIPEEYFSKMDDGLARQILKASSMIRVIDKKLLTSSPVAYYITRNPEMRAYVTNIGGVTRINNCAKIVKFDIALNNGMIHIVDNIIAPNYDTFMN